MRQHRNCNTQESATSHSCQNSAQPAYVSTSQGARRCSTAPLLHPTPIWSQVQAMDWTGLGALKKATASFLPSLASRSAWYTSTKLSFVVTRKCPVRCSVPAVALEKVKFSPGTSVLGVPVEMSQNLVKPSRLHETTVASSWNSTCVTSSLERFPHACQYWRYMEIAWKSRGSRHVCMRLPLHRRDRGFTSTVA